MKKDMKQRGKFLGTGYMLLGKQIYSRNYRNPHMKVSSKVENPFSLRLYMC